MSDDTCTHENFLRTLVRPREIIDPGSPTKIETEFLASKAETDGYTVFSRKKHDLVYCTKCRKKWRDNYDDKYHADILIERKRERERKGDFLPACNLCNDGNYMMFPMKCGCGR